MDNAAAENKADNAEMRAENKADKAEMRAETDKKFFLTVSSVMIAHMKLK